MYLKIQEYLLENGIEIRFNTLVEDLIIENENIKGVIVTDSRTKTQKEELFSDKVVVATGRKGADWLSDMCTRHNIAHKAGTVDIGVRVELRNEVMESVNNVLYE
ncbi:FAD-binding protein, partial [Streptococcus agalactiae]|uniref:FAD-binding protein n=1 Tax=Streptococcus agalactiae TaxID=1311 RepID=UPI0035A3C3BA